MRVVGVGVVRSTLPATGFRFARSSVQHRIPTCVLIFAASHAASHVCMSGHIHEHSLRGSGKVWFPTETLRRIPPILSVFYVFGSMHVVCILQSLLLPQACRAWQSTHSWQPQTAMARDINLALRRQAYVSSGFLSYLEDFDGELDEASASFCAVIYIDRLTKKILDRKARVDRDTALALERKWESSRKKALEAVFGSKQETTDSSLERTNEIEVRLVNALSGDEHCRVLMSQWSLLGDAVTKANCGLHHGNEGSSAAASVMPEVDEYMPVDKKQCQHRIHTLLRPGQKEIELRVLKGMGKAKPFDQR